MKRRQTAMARQWFIVDQRTADAVRAVRNLPRGTGVLVLHRNLAARERAALVRSLRRVARARALRVLDETDREFARVHDRRELRQALLKRTPLILLSPLNRTRSHPGRQPIPRMRAAALARLGGRRLLGLGGMDESKFRRIEPLGFRGWAGIDAWSER